MELNQVRFVVAVAELGNFTRAAERCAVVQSALSHQIAKLERELGARLFARTSRSVRLTAAGEAFLPEARRILEAVDRARAEVAAATGEIRGRLAVGVIPTVAAVDVPRALRAFHDRHGEVTVSLIMASSDALVRRVDDGRLDLALLGLPVGAETPQVSRHVLGVDRHVAVFPRRHRLADAERLRLSDLADEVFVDFPRGTPGRAQTDSAFDAAGVSRAVAFEVTDVHLMADLVRQGLGVVLLPSAYAPSLSGLPVLPLEDGPAREELIAWSRLGPSPAAAAFLDQLSVPWRTRDG